MRVVKVAKGFSLVELLIVIAILATLSTLAIIAVNPIQVFQKVHDSQRKSDLEKIQVILEQYRNLANGYPPTGTFSCGSTVSANGTVLLQKTPCDPKHGTPGYDYVYTSTGTDYTLTDCIEYKQDTDQRVKTDASCPDAHKKITLTAQ